MVTNLSKVDECVFSGKKSKRLWKLINKVWKKRKKKRKKILWAITMAMYGLGCYCQEFETKMDRMFMEQSKKRVKENINKIIEEKT